MRFDSGKAWPHPVLRPPSAGDDYPHADFQVEIEVSRSAGSTAVDVTAEFDLSDRDLLALVDAEVALYVLLIRASKTHYRDLFRSYDRRIVKAIGQGRLSGRVEVTPFLICTRRLARFRAARWHPDFGNRTFDIAPGSVLAEDEPKFYWVDTADEAPVGSLFVLHQQRGVTDGLWRCDLNQDRVAIVLSPSDYRRCTAARDRANRTDDGQYLMNGLYLPALIQVLCAADRDADAYADYRWFASLDQRLEAVGCEHLGSDRAERAVDAQKVLESPFAKMPMIAMAENES